MRLAKMALTVGKPTHTSRRLWIRAENILLEAAKLHATEADGLAAAKKIDLQHRFGVEPVELEPKVYYRLTDNWLELTVRFVIGTQRIRGAKDAMSRYIITELDKAGIGIASATYDIVGLPAIEIRNGTSGKQAAAYSNADLQPKVLVESLDEHDGKQPPPSKRDKGVVAPPDDEEKLPKNADPTSVEQAETERPLRWRGPGAVLCIAGRGPLDEAASAMLVQLLGKRGLSGRLVGYEGVSREKIETLDVQAVAMACISYLDISGSPAHLRYPIRRLRQRLPHGTPILVGLWPSEDATLKDESAQRSIGADYFTTSSSARRLHAHREDQSFRSRAHPRTGDPRARRCGPRLLRADGLAG